jgi:acyl-CoA dehydrogenase
MLRSAQIAGALQGMLEMTITYANERIQFGKAIGSFQAIQHQIAVLSEHTAASVMGAEAAFAESAETLGRLPVTAAKVCASEAAGIGASVAHGCTVPLALPTNTRCTGHAPAMELAQRVRNPYLLVGRTWPGPVPGRRGGLWASLVAGQLETPAGARA